jgi:branched-chain amino acid transport system permease protein
MLMWIPAILGLSILTGFTGLFSFGHAGFIAIGAYASAVMTKLLGLPFEVGIATGMIVAVCVAYLLGAMTLKLKGDYFCLATIAFGEIIRQLFSNLSFIGDARGMQGIPQYATLPYIVIVDVLLVLIAANLVFSRHGRNMVAIREEELAAQMIGVNVYRYKMIALLVSAALAAISGAFYSHAIPSIQPKDFGMDRSTELTIVLIIGGIGSISGSLLATIVLFTIPELFRQFSVWRLAVYGAIVVVIMITRPKGLMGGLELTPSSLGAYFRGKQLLMMERMKNAKNETGAGGGQ